MRDASLALLQLALDGALSAWPRRRPGVDAKPRLVAHRGNTGESGAAPENTLAAFRRCQALGIWGFEFDIRWTADGVPVVIHDADTVRVFGAPGLIIADTGFDKLRREVPEVPTLEEVVVEFKGRSHLWAELKTELDPSQQATLRNHLAPLEAVEDFHLMSLEPEYFERLRTGPREAMMVVAETNLKAMIASAIRLGLGSISGHYLLLRRSLRDDLRERGIGIGAGFIPGRSLLYRELELGSDWLFSNHAARVQTAIDRLP